MVIFSQKKHDLRPTKLSRKKKGGGFFITATYFDFHGLKGLKLGLR